MSDLSVRLLKLADEWNRWTTAPEDPVGVALLREAADRIEELERSADTQPANSK